MNFQMDFFYSRLSVCGLSNLLTTRARSLAAKEKNEEEEVKEDEEIIKSANHNTTMNCDATFCTMHYSMGFRIQ